MTFSLSHAFKSVAGASVCAIVFLIPLVACPWTTDPLDFNKYFLFVILATIGTLAFLGNVMVERKVSFKKHWFYVLPVVFLGLVALSSAVSITPFTSWFGQNGQEYAGFFGTVLLTVFFFVSSKLLSERAFQVKALSAFFLSSAMLSIFVLLTFLHVPLWAFSDPVGLPSMLGIFLLSSTVLGNGIWLVERGNREESLLPVGAWGAVIRGSILLTSAVTLLFLLALHLQMLWVLLFLGFLPVFVFALALPKEFPQPLRFTLPMLMIVAALLSAARFVFLPLPRLQNPYITEVSVPFSVSSKIVKGVFSEGRWLLGSGPGTYGDDYQKFVGPEVNTAYGGAFWDLRLDQGSSYFMTILSTHGLLGALAFLSIIFALGGLSMKGLLRSKTHGEWRRFYAVFATWFMMSAGLLFVIPGNFTIAVLYAFLTAVLATEVLGAEHEYSLANAPRAAIIAAFLSMFIGVGLLMIFLISASQYSAEIAFAEAVARDKEGADITEVIGLLNTAATRNSWSDAYYRNLANAFLIHSSQLSKKTDTDPHVLQSVIDMANRAAQQATNLAPNTVMNWELRGTLYRELSSAEPNANDLSISAFETAIRLAPSNPKYPVDLAQTYITRADLLVPATKGTDKALASKAQDEYSADLKKAESNVEKAIALKKDYALAYYYQSFIADRQGSLADAVKDMELVRATNPKDVGVSLQLALLYMRQGKNDLAQAELQRALEIAPTFANAHWYLSSIYAAKGETDKAIAELQEIQKNDPLNTSVQQRLDALKNGKTVSPSAIPAPIDSSASPTSP